MNIPSRMALLLNAYSLQLQVVRSSSKHILKLTTEIQRVKLLNMALIPHKLKMTVVKYFISASMLFGSCEFSSSQDCGLRTRYIFKLPRISS